MFWVVGCPSPRAGRGRAGEAGGSDPAVKPRPGRRCAVAPGPTTFPRGPRGCAEAAAQAGFGAVGRLERRVCERQDRTVKSPERVRAECVGVCVRETGVPVCKMSAGVGPRERLRGRDSEGGCV